MESENNFTETKEDEKTDQAQPIHDITDEKEKNETPPQAQIPTPPPQSVTATPQGTEATPSIAECAFCGAALELGGWQTMVFAEMGYFGFSCGMEFCGFVWNFLKIITVLRI